MPDFSNNPYAAVIDTPIAGVRLGILFKGSAVSEIDFLPGDFPLIGFVAKRRTRLLQALDDYFADPAKKIDVEVAPCGTPFQQRVWYALCDIAPGEILTYGDLARRLNTSPRAIGNACRANPLPIIVPCHRVVAETGLGGYMGNRSGTEMKIKRWLLQHEGIAVG